MALVSFGKAPSHQHIRDEGGPSGSAIVKDGLQKQSGPHHLGQHFIGGLHQQTGRMRSAELCALM